MRFGFNQQSKSKYIKLQLMLKKKAITGVRESSPCFKNLIIKSLKDFRLFSVKERKAVFSVEDIKST